MTATDMQPDSGEDSALLHLPLPQTENIYTSDRERPTKAFTLPQSFSDHHQK
jgi:hypothetical protein